MKLLKTFNLPLSDGSIKSIEFGHPETAKEKREMYHFRYENYLRHNYIDKNRLKDELDQDEYDLANKCVYFVAKVDGQVIGTVRLIIDDPLPTEKDCFLFTEPEKMKLVDRHKRAELSRLIVDRYMPDKHFPRHFIMLGLLFCIIEYSNKNGLIAGYGFIKDSLKKKLIKIKMPVHFIDEFKQVYGDGILRNYFSDEKNPVWPIYYFADEVDKYLNLVIKYSFSLSGKTYSYREMSLVDKASLAIQLYLLK